MEWILASQEDIVIQRLDPQATLYRALLSTNSVVSGNFTKYGDVTSLLLNEDDEFVIGRQGDAVSIAFPTANLTLTPENWTRDVFLLGLAGLKIQMVIGGSDLGSAVEPLPFHNMSGFPYLHFEESYPYDAAHLSYLQEYNTRTINNP